MLQALPAAHLVLQLPPQSTSVSVPFFTPSVQVGTWQMLPVQTPLMQSPGPPQPPPSMQGPQFEPQSTPVSVPFLTLSEQVAVAHLPPVQTRLSQSEFAPQSLPSAHLLQVAPPQSTSLSSLVFVWSSQFGTHVVPEH